MWQGNGETGCLERKKLRWHFEAGEARALEKSASWLLDGGNCQE